MFCTIWRVFYHPWHLNGQAVSPKSWVTSKGSVPGPCISMRLTRKRLFDSNNLMPHPATRLDEPLRPC